MWKLKTTKNKAAASSCRMIYYSSLVALLITGKIDTLFVPVTNASSTGSSVPPPPQHNNQGWFQKPPVKDEDIIPGTNSTRRELVEEPAVESWRSSLPASIRNRQTLHKLNIDGVCEVYLLGTSHVSKSSCMDVKTLMKHVQPDCLFIELCPQRIGILAPPPPPTETSADTNAPPSNKETIQNLQADGMSRASAISATLLTKIQSDYATKLGVSIGSEFREAYEMAQQQHATDLTLPCRVVLGDRPVRITLLRAWESLNLWYRIKLVVALLWSTIRQPSEKELSEWMESIFNDKNGTDILTKSMEELSASFPTIGHTVIEERNVYMWCKLQQTVRALGVKKIVAVVGAGHCTGICGLEAEEEAAVKSNINGVSSGDFRLEEMLVKIVETKRRKVGEDEEIRSLVTGVLELNLPLPQL